MDRHNTRHQYWNTSSRSNQSGLKGRPPPRLAPHDPPPIPPPHVTPQDDLINYIYESWNKITQEGVRVWEPPRPSTQRPPLPPLDLEGWWGRQCPNSVHHNS